MYEVYANSFCNISATAAIDGTRGLFFPRDPQGLWEDEINLNTNGLLQEQHMQRQSKLPRGYSPLVRRCEVFDLAFWDRLVESSPVNRRGWVLQERLLAPRVLHFCEDQIAWECPEHDAAESFPDGLPKLELSSGKIVEKVRLKGLLSYHHEENEIGEQVPKRDGQKPDCQNPTQTEEKELVFIDPEQTSEMVHDHWKLVVERYSTTGLSRESDKLIALAGMAKLMAERIRGRYVAGMWEKYLASQLSWRVKTAYENGRLLYPSRRPKEYRAPTFSWASVDAPQGIQCSETKRERELHVAIRHIHVMTRTSPYGPLKKTEGTKDTSDSCFIDIDCMMTPVKIELHDYKGNPRYICKFWIVPEGPATDQQIDKAPEHRSGQQGDTEAGGRQGEAVSTDGAETDTYLEQDSMPLEVPCSPNGLKAEQAKAGAEREEQEATPDTSTAHGTTTLTNGHVHSTVTSTVPQPQGRVLETKSTVGVYLDCPEDDGEELGSADAESYCVPASTNSVGDLVCLLIQLQKLSHETSPVKLYRRVGLLAFPAFLPEDQKMVLRQARENHAQIRLI